MWGEGGRRASAGTTHSHTIAAAKACGEARAPAPAPEPRRARLLRCHPTNTVMVVPATQARPHRRPCVCACVCVRMLWGKPRRTAAGVWAHPSGAPAKTRRLSAGEIASRVKKLERRRDELTRGIEADEARMAEIDATFCEPGFYDRTPASERTSLEEEREALGASVSAAMEEWEGIEARIERLGSTSQAG